VYRQALKAGYIEIFMEAGAVVTNPTCGACSGGHMGLLGANETCITASTRNNKGRYGRPERAHLHGVAGDGRGVRRDRRHHRSGRISSRCSCEGRVMIAGRVWKFGDNINIEMMLPQAALYLPEKERIRYVFQAHRPGWVDQVRPGDFIIGGHNYGVGSSRPAPLQLRNVGIACLIAESTTDIFFRNAVNFGLLTLQCPGVHAAFARARPLRCRPRISPSATARPEWCCRPSAFRKTSSR
jgi:aconitase A